MELITESYRCNLCGKVYHKMEDAIECSDSHDLNYFIEEYERIINDNFYKSRYKYPTWYKYELKSIFYNIRESTLDELLRKFLAKKIDDPKCNELFKRIRTMIAKCKYESHKYYKYHLKELEG